MSPCNCQYQFAGGGENATLGKQTTPKDLDGRKNLIGLMSKLGQDRDEIKAWLKLLHKMVELMRVFIEPIYPPETHS